MSRYPIEGVKVRYVDALRLAHLFLGLYNQRYKTDVRVDPAKLFIVMRSTMDDVQRYKDYHLEAGTVPAKLSDAVKRAAFVTKWIHRIKPLWEVLPDYSEVDFDYGEALSRPALLVNQEFSVSLALLYLSDHAKLDIRLAPIKLYELMYSLVYRNLTDDSLLLYYQMLVDIKIEKQIFI